jgi:hypothetical protein
VSNPFDAPPDFEVMSPDDPRAVEALGKAAPDTVNYHPVGDVSERCATCAMFKPAPKREDMLRDVDGCTSVRGAIFDDWVCDLYEPAEEGEVRPDLDDDAESA